jgi:hypothetical protein
MDCLLGEFLNKKLEDFTFFVELGLTDARRVDFGVPRCCFVESMLSRGTFRVGFFSKMIVSKSTEYLKVQVPFKCMKSIVSCSLSPLFGNDLQATDFKKVSN